LPPKRPPKEEGEGDADQAEEEGGEGEEGSGKEITAIIPQVAPIIAEGQEDFLYQSQSELRSALKAASALPGPASAKTAAKSAISLFTALGCRDPDAAAEVLSSHQVKFGVTLSITVGDTSVSLVPNTLHN
jgi:hypothetical protein